MTSDESTTKDEWESRQLCSDGNCIGVIGPDGRCKECGKKYEGDLSRLNIPEEASAPPAEAAAAQHPADRSR